MDNRLRIEAENSSKTEFNQFIQTLPRAELNQLIAKEGDAIPYIVAYQDLDPFIQKVNPFKLAKNLNEEKINTFILPKVAIPYNDKNPNDDEVIQRYENFLAGIHGLIMNPLEIINESNQEECKTFVENRIKQLKDTLQEEQETEKEAILGELKEWDNWLKHFQLFTDLRDLLAEGIEGINTPSNDNDEASQKNAPPKSILHALCGLFNACKKPQSVDNQPGEQNKLLRPNSKIKKLNE